MLKQLGRGQGHAELLVYPLKKPDGQQRVATQLEEVVVHTDALDTQQLAPDRRDGPLHLGAGFRELARPRGAVSGWRGRARRSILPFGVSGHSSMATKTEGIMWCGIWLRRCARSSAAVGAPPVGASTYATSCFWPDGLSHATTAH